MNKVSKASLYRGKAVNSYLNNAKFGPTLNIYFEVTQEQKNGEWEDLPAPLETSGFFTVQEKDGSISEHNKKVLQSFVDSFGWDNKEGLDALVGDMSSLNPVQVRVMTNPSGQYLNAKYVNPYEGSNGRSDAVSAADLSSINAKLRTLSFGVPSVSMQPRNEGPTKKEAWTIFHEMRPNMNADEIRAEWLATTMALLIGDNPTPEQCKLLADSTPGQYVKVVAEEEIPF